MLKSSFPDSKVQIKQNVRKIFSTFEADSLTLTGSTLFTAKFLCLFIYLFIFSDFIETRMRCESETNT